MEKKINIAFDVDGVLFDTRAFIFQYGVPYFKNKGIDVVDEKGCRVKEIFGCTVEEEKKFWYKYAIKYFLFYRPQKNVVITINKLRDEGNNVYLITAKNWVLTKFIGKISKFLFKTGLWLNKIKVNDIIYCSVDNSSKEKAEICEQLNISCMIEDGVENANEISKQTKVLLMDTEYNYDYNGTNIKRVYNLDDIYAEIKRIEANDLGVESIFNTYQYKSKEEKMLLSTSELKEYYLNLPFDEDKLIKGEGNFKIIANTYGSYFRHKYNTQLIDPGFLEEVKNEEGVIFASNHLCNKDMLLILSTLKEIVWHPLIKKEILEENSGILFKLVESVFVDRKDPQSRKEATIEMGKILLHGGNILTFPEGTYNRGKSNLKIFEGNSAVYLSQALDRFIVPMALTQNYGRGQNPIIRLAKPIKIGIEENLDEGNNRLYSIMDGLVEKNKQIIMLKNQNRIK